VLPDLYSASTLSGVSSKHCLCRSAALANRRSAIVSVVHGLTGAALLVLEERGESVTAWLGQVKANLEVVRRSHIVVQAGELCHPVKVIGGRRIVLVGIADAAWHAPDRQVVEAALASLADDRLKLIQDHVAALGCFGAAWLSVDLQTVTVGSLASKADDIGCF